MTDIVSRLRNRVDELEEEVRQLRMLLVGGAIQRVPGLSRAESIVVRAIAAAGDGAADSDRLYAALYGLRTICDLPSVKIIGLFVFKARRKLRARGIAIETIRGEGWHINAEGRARLAAQRSAEPLDVDRRAS